MRSRTNTAAADPPQGVRVQIKPSGLEQRRQDAITRYLAGDPIAVICQEFGCSRSWLYKWKQRYQITEPHWSHEQSRRPETTPTKTPQAVEVAIVHLRQMVLLGTAGTISALVIRERLRQQHVESIPSLHTIYRILKRHTTEVTSNSYTS
jgi:transposase-like protein